MEGEEEDCVVREVPVVFTRSLTGLHYLLQVSSICLRFFVPFVVFLTVYSVSTASCLARHLRQQCQQLQVQANPAAAQNRCRNQCRKPKYRH